MLNSCDGLNKWHWSQTHDFFYCDVVFSRHSSVDNRRLQVVFNSWTRYVFNLRRFDHLSTRAHRDELLGMPLCTFYESRVLSIFFKLILTRRLTFLFVDVRNARSVRTSNFILA
jgi:hypothetical protein